MVRTPFVLALLGTSLTSGRLSADWVPLLTRELQDYPEAKGPIKIYNLGKGSQNSNWGVTQMPLLVSLKPTHVLMEGFAINDCIDFGGGPAVTRAQHSTNIQAMVTALQAGIPGVDITLQTMNPVSAAGAAIRPDLANYYADEIFLATTLNVGSIDNYASWPHPLPTMLSYGAAIGYSGFTGTWNPADKSANITLSNVNFTATSDGTADQGVRATTGKSSGKWYFDVVLSTALNSSVGIMPSGGSLSARVGSNLGYGLYTSSLNGNIYANGPVVGNLGPNADGDLIGVCVDFTLLKIWWARNGVWLNGNPVAGTGGETIAAGTYFPAVSLSINTQNALGNFGTVYPGDGLHPLFTGGLDTYFYPLTLAYARARMAALWP